MKAQEYFKKLLQIKIRRCERNDILQCFLCISCSFIVQILHVNYYLVQYGHF